MARPSKEHPRQRPNFKAVYAVTVIVLVVVAILVFIVLMPPWYGWN